MFSGVFSTVIRAVLVWEGRESCVQRREAELDGAASLERAGIQGDLLQSAVRSCGKDGTKLFLGLHRNRTRGSRNEVQHRTHPADFRTELSP